MSKILILSLMGLLLAGCSSSKTDTTLTTLTGSADAVYNEVKSDTEDRVGTVIDDDGADNNEMVASSDTSDMTNTNPGSYLEGNAGSLDTLISEGKKVILFFHADRCPTCQALDKDIQINISKIPSDMAIVKLNYDQEEALKLKYNVKNQNTIVYLDKNKNALASKAGGIIALDEVIKNIP